MKQQLITVCSSNTSCVVITAILSLGYVYFRYEKAVNRLHASSSRADPEQTCCAAFFPSITSSSSGFGGVPADCREILLPLMTDQLKFHLEKEEELQACCQLLSDILEVLYRKDVVRNMDFLLF